MKGLAMRLATMFLQSSIITLLLLCSCYGPAFAQAEPKDMCNLYRQYDKYVLFNEYRPRLTTADFGLVGTVKSVENHIWSPEPTRIEFDKNGLVSGIRTFWGWGEEAVRVHNTYLWDKQGRMDKITMTHYEYDGTVLARIGAVPAYDPEGRITRIEFLLEEGPKEDMKDPGIDIVTYTYDARGLLTGYGWKGGEGGIRVEFARDGDGRLVREERTTEGEVWSREYRIDYGYDESGRLTDMTYVDRETEKPTDRWEYSYTYDPDGLIEELEEKRFEYEEDGKKYLYAGFTRYHYDKHMNVVRYDCAATSDNLILVEYY